MDDTTARLNDSWTTGFFESDGIRLHYYRTGGAKPPLLLAHGFSDNGLCWNRLARASEANYDIVMMDARGHGLSGAPSDYVQSAQAADIAAFVSALGLVKPALLGHSMGAAVAAVTAANYPDLLSCVLLEDPPWIPTPDATAIRLMGEMADLWKEDMVKMQAQTIEEIIAAAKQDHPDWDESEWLPWAESKKQLNLAAFSQIGAISEGWEETVKRITCPILLLTADQGQGALVSPDIAAAAAKMWRHGRVVHCSGAGHSIRRERFDCYLEAVSQFLNEHLLEIGGMTK